MLGDVISGTVTSSVVVDLKALLHHCVNAGSMPPIEDPFLCVFITGGVRY